MHSSEPDRYTLASPSTPLPSLRRKAWFGLVMTGMVMGFDVAGFRTNWLLPKPLFCGQILQELIWLPNVSPDLKLEPGSQAVCVHEVIKPYSHLSGSATVSMSLRNYNGSLKLFDTQFFLAKNVGSKRFNDTRGDWIFLNSTDYAAQGWVRRRSPVQVASWSSNFLTLQLRERIWEMMQDQLVGRDLSEHISLQRSVAVFVAINGGLLIVFLLLLGAATDLIREHQRSIALAVRPANFLHSLSRLQNLGRLRGWPHSILVATGLSVVTGLLVVSRFTSWVQPRPFWCKQYSEGWKICLHEIHRLPSNQLRMIVLGVSIWKPDQSRLYAKMQVFTALPADKIGFVDVPGSWHFMDRSYFSSTGWLVRRVPETLSSIVDPLLPSDVQVAFWNDIAHSVQSNYNARRLSAQSKLLEVSESYLLLLLGVLLAIWTLLMFLELRLMSILQDSASDSSASPSNA